MVSKLCGTLIIEEELSIQLKSYDQQNQVNHLVLSTKSERNLRKTGLKKNILAHVMDKSRDIWIWLWAQLYCSYT